MKKAIKIVAIVLALAFLVLQVFQIDKANPRVVEGETLEAAINVPADVSQIIARSCNDCHSNKTVYPWYTSVQPNGWFMKDHIDEGRRELNFSVFNTYSKEKKDKKLEEICEEANAGHMPLPSYLWIHRDAALSDSDRQALCDWATETRARLASAE
jgi:hypothetical protein